MLLIQNILFRFESVPPVVRSFHIVHQLIQSLHIEADQNAFFVRKVADDLNYRFRKLAHKRGHGKYLVAGRQLRILYKVYDLDHVSSRKMRFADPLQVRKGRRRPRRLSGDIKAKSKLWPRSRRIFAIFAVGRELLLVFISFYLRLP